MMNAIRYTNWKATGLQCLGLIVYILGLELLVLLALAVVLR